MVPLASLTQGTAGDVSVSQRPDPFLDPEFAIPLLSQLNLNQGPILFLYQFQTYQRPDGFTRPDDGLDLLVSGPVPVQFQIVRSGQGHGLRIHGPLMVRGLEIADLRHTW